MDVIITSNNNLVNGMTTLMNGPINDMDKVIKSKSSQSMFASDISGFSKWIFMSPTKQTSSVRLFIQ